MSTTKIRADWLFSQISHMLHSIMLNRKINKTHLIQYKFLLKFRSFFSILCIKICSPARARVKSNAFKSAFQRLFLWDFCPVLQECGTGSPFFHATVFRILVLRHYKYNFPVFLKLLNFICNSINYEQRQNAQK